MSDYHQNTITEEVQFTEEVATSNVNVDEVVIDITEYLA